MGWEGRLACQNTFSHDGPVQCNRMSSENNSRALYVGHSGIPLQGWCVWNCNMYWSTSRFCIGRFLSWGSTLSWNTQLRVVATRLSWQEDLTETRWQIGEGICISESARPLNPKWIWCDLGGMSRTVAMRWSWVYDLKSIRKASSDRDRKRSRAAPASTDLLILERDSGHGPVAHLKWLKQPTKRAQKGAKRPGTCFLELCGALCHGI